MDNEYLKWLKEEYVPICGGADDPPTVTEPPAAAEPAATEPVVEPPAPPDTETPEQLKARVAAAEERATRAENVARQTVEMAQAKKQLSPEDFRKWVEENISTDPLMVTSKIAEDHAWRIQKLITGKNNVIEEYMDKHPEFQGREREIKRKLANFFPPTQRELEERIDLECHAAVGRDSGKKISEARKQGAEDAEKKKRVLGAGTAVGSTPGKTVDNVALNAEETSMAQRMGLSIDKVKEAQKKGNVVE